MKKEACRNYGVSFGVVVTMPPAFVPFVKRTGSKQNRTNQKGTGNRMNRIRHLAKRAQGNLRTYFFLPNNHFSIFAFFDF